MTQCSFKIDGRMVGDKCVPYVIAEMSANHNGDIENAYKIIAMAKAMGADAVKMQTYTPDTMTLDCDSEDFQLTDGLWQGRSLYNLYEQAYTPWDWHRPLFDYAKKIGISLFSSPFDHTAVDLLEDLNTPAYKIASFEAIDLPLISYVASTGKPMIISTGMANEEEIQHAIDAARTGGCKELAILHCVSGYPAPAEDYNLTTLVDMRRKFGLPVGLSDHTLDNITAFTSIALGACIIEKHVTLDRRAGGPDDSFSLQPDGLNALTAGVKTAWKSLGKIDYGQKASEQSNIKFRRSLYFIKDMAEGEIVSNEHFKSIRPGYGLKPQFHEQLLGKKTMKDIKRGMPVSWDLVK